MVDWIGWPLAAYLCGSVPFGWLLGKLAGVDIRRAGSGNIGATNLYRQRGWRYGVPALLLDAAKGVVPVLFFAPRVNAEALAPDLAPVVLGLAAILGHTFPVWFKFKGGKGVATGAGVLGALFPVPLLVALAVFAAVLAATRYVSLGSMTAALTLAAVATTRSPDPFGADAARLACAWIVAALVIALHRGNIRRLWTGTENRFRFRRPNPPSAASEAPPRAE